VRRRMSSNIQIDLTWPRLCDVRFTSVTANIDLSNVTLNSRTGDFNPTSLAHVINTDVVNRLVVQTSLDIACEYLRFCQIVLDNTTDC
jgi:hypothetical protein